MKRLIISAFLVTALGWAACTDEEESITINGDNTIAFTATKQGATEDDGLKKTAIVNDIAMFEASDVLTVYGSVGKSVTLSNNSTTKAKTTTFKSMVTAAEYAEFSKSKMYYGAMPSTATKKFSDVTEASATISMTLPNSQSPVLNGIDPDAYLLVGATSTNAFTFKSVCAYMKVYVSHPLKSLEITSTGDPLTGDVDVTLKSDNTLSVKVTGNPSNKLTFGALETGYYYIPVLPGTYSLSVKPTFSDGVAGDMTAKEITTKSNETYGIKLGAGVTLSQDILHAYVPKTATSISFLYENLDGYTDVDPVSGTALPTGIHVSSKGDDYVVYTEPKFYILAPEDCSYMFAGDDTKDNGNYTIQQYGVITSIVLTNFNTKNMTNMSHMFYSCKKLTTLDVSKFNTLKVVNMASLFERCYLLPTLNISNFNTSIVTDMNSMFAYCMSMGTIDVTGFDTKQVTNMAFMFYYCDLSTIDVSKLETGNVTDMQFMFSMGSLESIDVSNFDTRKVTNMTYMFSDNYLLTDITFGDFSTEAVKNMSGMFDQCFDLVTLDLSSFKTDKVTTMSKMFRNCSNLKNLDISNFNTEAVTDISNMFEQCLALETLDLSSFKTTSVKTITDMFAKCNSLKTIYANDFIGPFSSTTNIFGGCGKLVATDADDDSKTCSYAEQVASAQASSQYASHAVVFDGTNTGYFTDPSLKPASSK